jgi:hypothetical protein
MVRYVYYEPITMQVEAEIDTPELVDWPTWEVKGYLRAIVLPGLTVTRNHIISIEDVLIDGEPHTVVAGSTVNVNPVQPDYSKESQQKGKKDAAKVSGRAKLKALGMTDEEIDVL